METKNSSIGKEIANIVLETVVETALELATLGIYVWVGQAIWNAVVPDVFSLPTITYLQSLNLLVLFNVFVSFSSKLNKHNSK